MAQADNGGDADDNGMDLFQEPSDYYAPEKPATTSTYTLKDGQALSLRFVGHSPLWVGSACAASM